MMYQAAQDRYEKLPYRRCGKSGVKLPFLSLGFWHNFGETTPYNQAKEMILGAFDRGITHFDIANGYGPPAGGAERVFGKLISQELKSYRDEILVSTKAGYRAWEGPYGEWGSRKNLMASLDRSLLNLGLDYVDIFYHHRPDPETPLEETVAALADMIHQGKALYVGISNYNAYQTAEILPVFEKAGVHCLLHQVPYSMFNRKAEEGLFQVLERHGVGAIAFMCLAQGMLTNKYFNGIPNDSRAAGASRFLTPEQVTPEKIAKAKQLDELAAQRGQSLAEMAIAWSIRKAPVASILIGASRLEQIDQNMKALNNLDFSQEELDIIDKILMQ